MTRTKSQVGTGRMLGNSIILPSFSFEAFRGSLRLLLDHVVSQPLDILFR